MTLSITAKADLLTDILTKKLDAQALSSHEMDSILNPAPSLSAEDALLPQNRYSLDHDSAQKIFRHSFWANYVVKDHKKGEDIPVSDTLIREAEISPNGQYVVYGKGQNLFIYKVLFKTEVPITTDTKDIFNGMSDWLYEEEFGITRLFWFSPDSKQVAFVRLDEQSVPTFSWQVYAGRQYPDMKSLRYPKAGTANAQASVCIYDISTKGIRTIKLPELQDSYIPRLKWRSEDELIIERVNRDQTKIEIFSANPKSTVCTSLYTEASDRYFVDYELFDQWQWLTDGRMVILSEKGGWRQLYLYSAQGYEQKLLTPANIDITQVYGVDEKSGLVYYQAAPNPAERHLYAVNLKSGKISSLTSQAGTHALTFAKDMRTAIDCYQSVLTANQYTLYEVKADKLASPKLIKDNKDLEAAWAQTGLTGKQFICIPTERGDTLDAWVILPKELADIHSRSARKYPVVLMQYSGPASQRVLNTWRHRFGHYLAAQGYIVVNADPRGTDCRGRAWRNETYMNLGQKEAEDHLSVARFMQQLPCADSSKIAMIGWSYGGFQTIRTMCEQTAPLIKCGIAIAPVTDWTLYDTGYTERFMRRPQVNDKGYQAADLTQMANRLQGHLLLVHSTGDDNVHFQNTLLLSDALVKAGKQFDTQLYIDDNHSLLDKTNNEHLHRKILDFLKKNL